MIEMKAVVARILQKFEVFVREDFQPVLLAEVILRSENGIRLRFEKRGSAERQNAFNDDGRIL